MLNRWIRCVEFEFDETRSWFAQPVNYWENGAFDSQTMWLLEKRERCIKDLKALRQLLDRLQCNPPATKIERESSFASALRQASGAFGEIEHIEKLISLIHPAFNFAALPSVRFEKKRESQSIPRRGYYAEVRHAP